MIRRVLITVLLLTAFTFGQVRRTGGGTISTSGGVVNIQNDIGGTVAAFELIVNGSPASLTVTTQGCMRGGTCDSAVDTYTGTSTSIRQITVSSVYDYFAVQATFSGGTSPSVVVNSTITAGTSTPSEKGKRAPLVSNPAAGSQATVSVAASAGITHVADCVSFSGAATTAPIATALTVNLRDGVTGAGTILWTKQLVVTASTGQLISPFAVCGLAIPGTSGNAMTLEFSASLANLIEEVSLSTYDVK